MQEMVVAAEKVAAEVAAVMLNQTTEATTTTTAAAATTTITAASATSVSSPAGTSQTYEVFRLFPLLEISKPIVRKWLGENALQSLARIRNGNLVKARICH